jgi:hypothetical protein
MAVYAFAGKEIKPKPQQSETWHAGEIKYPRREDLGLDQSSQGFQLQKVAGGLRLSSRDQHPPI